MTIHSIHVDGIDLSSDLGLVDSLGALLRDLESRAAMLHVASEDFVSLNPTLPAYFDSMERELKNARKILEAWHEGKSGTQAAGGES